MTITNLVSELDFNTIKTKLVYDFKSKFVQISNWKGDVVWSGSLRDLEENELNFEVIPALLEEE